MNIRLLLSAIGCSVTAAVLAGAQAPSETFQFVSVRRVAGDCSPQCLGPLQPTPIAQSSMKALPDGRFEARAETVQNLARIAYGFEFSDPRRGVVDGTRIPQDRFDITAVADREWTTPRPGESMPAELRPMLRALLENRFKLEARIENRKVDVYALRLSNRDGKLGPGLRKSADDCLGPSAAVPPDDSGRRPRCLLRADQTGVEARAATMADAARFLARLSPNYRDRLVVDDTGLEGSFDLTLSLRPAERSTPLPLNLTGESPNSPGLVAALPMGGGGGTVLPTQPMVPHSEIVKEMDRQLGLKLDRTSVPLPTLILERMKTPLED